MERENYSKEDLRNLLIDNVGDGKIKKALIDEWGREILSFSDIHAQIVSFAKEGFKPGLKTGISEEFDNHYTVRKREWTLVTGIPGAGKTEFLDNIMIGMIRKYNWKFGLFSAENLPHARHAGALMEKYVNIAMEDLKDDKDLFYCTELELSRNIFFINPHEDNITVDRILHLAEILVTRKEIDALIIDPWNEMDYTRTPGLNDTENISRALTKIRRFARIHNIHIFLIAHPTKLKKDDKGKYPVPTPYDVAGSSHFRNKADNALSLWYDVDRPGTAKVYIQKIRFREVGKLGDVDLNYNVKTGVYSPLTVSSIGTI